MSDTQASMSLLQLEGLEAGYGRTNCLHGVSLEVRAGEIVALLGANGSGKTTTLMAISGLVGIRAGAVTFKNRTLNRASPVDVVRLGISHVPEGRRILPRLTVLENLALGAYLRRDRQALPRDLERVCELFPILAARRRQLAGTLSGGEQQMLAIGRCLVMSPRLILLDEPSLGLAPATADLIFERIEEIHRNERVTTLLVEQRVAEALQSCDTGYVLETGRVVLQGPRDALLANDRVRQAYLGM